MYSNQERCIRTRTIKLQAWPDEKTLALPADTDATICSQIETPCRNVAIEEGRSPLHRCLSLRAPGGGGSM